MAQIAGEAGTGVRADLPSLRLTNPFETELATLPPVELDCISGRVQRSDNIERWAVAVSRTLNKARTLLIAGSSLGNLG